MPEAGNRHLEHTSMHTHDRCFNKEYGILWSRVGRVVRIEMVNEKRKRNIMNIYREGAALKF